MQDLCLVFTFILAASLLPGVHCCGDFSSTLFKYVLSCSALLFLIFLVIELSVGVAYVFMCSWWL